MSLLYSIGNVAARLRSLTGPTLLRAVQTKGLVQHGASSRLVLER